MRLIDADRLLSDKMKSKYYHLRNGDVAIPIVDIEHAPTVGVWISVKDRLPIIGESVLIWAKGKKDGFIGDDVTAVTYMNDAIYFGSKRIKVDAEWQEPFQYFLENYEVTHWMPIEPPKEADADD